MFSITLLPPFFPSLAGPFCRAFLQTECASLYSKGPLSDREYEVHKIHQNVQRTCQVIRNKMIFLYAVDAQQSFELRDDDIGMERL